MKLSKNQAKDKQAIKVIIEKANILKILELQINKVWDYKVKALQMKSKIILITNLFIKDLQTQKLIKKMY
jgi:hypothetical protein